MVRLFPSLVGSVVHIENPSVWERRWRRSLKWISLLPFSEHRPLCYHMQRELLFLWKMTSSMWLTYAHKQWHATGSVYEPLVFPVFQWLDRCFYIWQSYRKPSDNHVWLAHLQLVWNSKSFHLVNVGDIGVRVELGTDFVCLEKEEWCGGQRRGREPRALMKYML